MDNLKFRQVCAKILTAFLTISLLISAVCIKNVNITFAKEITTATDSEVKNFLEGNAKPIMFFTMRSYSNEMQDSYFNLQDDNTLAVTSKSGTPTLFALYAFGDGTNAIKCLTNNKYLSFKAYKPEDEYVIKADAESVGWNERFKVYDDGQGHKNITSHFTNIRDTEKRDRTKCRRLSLVNYKNQSNTLSLNEAIPAENTDCFIFDNAEAPKGYLDVSSEVSGNTATLNLDVKNGYENDKNYIIEEVNGDNVKEIKNAAITIKNNKVKAVVNDLDKGKETTIRVKVIDDDSNVIASKDVKVRIFNHLGLIFSQDDLDKIRNHVKNKMEPWYSDFVKLQKTAPNDIASLDFVPKPHVGVGRGTPADSGNIGDLEKSALAAYLDAIQWVATGDDVYADKAVEILNAWSYNLEVIDGRDNILGAGIHGYKFANAAEILRYYNGGYKGYGDHDFKKLQNMLLNVFYPVIQDFGVPMTANGNWDSAAYNTMISIGVVCDNTEIFNRAVNYYKSDYGNGSIKNYVDDSGQCQETGRDQGHAQLGIGYMAELCEVSWNQGIDLYSLENNRLYKAFEYCAKLNLFNDVPFHTMTNVYNDKSDIAYWPDRIDTQSANRGRLSGVYELPLSHYRNMGFDCEWMKKITEAMGTEGVIDYDHLNSYTLTKYNGEETKEQRTPYFRMRTDYKNKTQRTLSELADGTYVVETRDSYIDLQPDNTLTITTMRVNAPFFQMILLDDGTCAIKCLKNNKYLSLKRYDDNVIKADADTIGEAEKFNWVAGGAPSTFTLSSPLLKNRKASLVSDYKGSGYDSYKGADKSVFTDDEYLTLSFDNKNPSNDKLTFRAYYNTEEVAMESQN